jgi:hypothetical protein
VKAKPSVALSCGRASVATIGAIMEKNMMQPKVILYTKFQMCGLDMIQ